MIAALRLHIPSDDSVSRLTLRDYYLESILPEIQHEQAPSSLSEDRTALNHWERHTSNPALTEITAQHLAQLRDGLTSGGASPATVNKCWRELRSMFNWAAEDGAIEKAPQISRRSKSRLVKQPPKRQRETLTDAEISRLWLGCRKATYPAKQHCPAPKLWRVAIVLWYFYGARTLDVIGQLKWTNILWSDRLLQFTA